MRRHHLLFPALLLGLLLALALGLSWANLNAWLPRAQWQEALWRPNIDAIDQMLFHYSLLPRFVVSLLVGAGLGLVGVLFQQVLRNPLAEPTTLGVATGAAWRDRGDALGAAGRRADRAVRGAGRCLRGRVAGVWRRLG